jgi:hypothetical protein
MKDDSSTLPEQALPGKSSDLFKVLKANNSNLCSPYVETNESLQNITYLNFQFMTYREELGFRQVPRKLKLDSLLKKCKAKFFKLVHESVNSLLNLPLDSFRLKQEFITNVNIETNKLWLSNCLRQIYIENGLDVSIEHIQKIFYINNESLKLFNELMDMTYEEAFKNYLTSKRYLKDYQSIESKDGKKFAKIFDYVSKFYITYYVTGRGNIMKKVRKNMKKQKESNETDLSLSMRRDDC